MSALAGFRFRIDRRALAAELVHEAAADALGDAAEHLLELANRTVPIEEGTLARSGGTDLDRDELRASFFWDTPYAARQHEELNYRHDPGRRAKWAEHTMREQAGHLGGFLAERIAGRLP